MAEKVTIGCRLPHGVRLRHPMHEQDRSKDVTIDGLNKVKIIGARYATTQVDADFWEQWESMNKDFPSLKNGALFVAKNPNQAADMAKDIVKEKTGLEAVEKDSHGVKTVNKED